MDKAGNEFDPTWTPPRYDKYDPEATGSWRAVNDESNVIAGVIWTDFANAAGVTWVTQTDAITRLDLHFRQMKSIGATAGAAYTSAQQLPGVSFGEEQDGKLADLTLLLKHAMPSGDQTASPK